MSTTAASNCAFHRWLSSPVLIVGSSPLLVLEEAIVQASGVFHGGHRIETKLPEGGREHHARRQAIAVVGHADSRLVLAPAAARREESQGHAMPRPGAWRQELRPGRAGGRRAGGHQPQRAAQINSRRSRTGRLRLAAAAAW